MEEILKKRGPYTLDLTKQIKVRVNEVTFKQLLKMSEETDRPISSILREVISNRLNPDKSSTTIIYKK